MEARFKTSTVLSEAEYKAFVHLVRHVVNRKAYVRYICLLAIEFILLLFLTIWSEGLSLAGFQRYWLLWGLFTGMVFSLYAQIRVSYRDYRVVQNVRFERAFYDDAFESIQEHVYQRIEYAAIISIYHGKGCYFFMSKFINVILPERCFVEGDPAAFGAFLEEKTGLKVKKSSDDKRRFQ